MPKNVFDFSLNLTPIKAGLAHSSETWILSKLTMIIFMDLKLKLFSNFLVEMLIVLWLNLILGILLNHFAVRKYSVPLVSIFSAELIPVLDITWRSNKATVKLTDQNFQLGITLSSSRASLNIKVFSQTSSTIFW